MITLWGGSKNVKWNSIWSTTLFMNKILFCIEICLYVLIYDLCIFSVIVPPESVQVNDDTGPTKNGMTSPYAEGASMTLLCTASGGRPPPKITWSRDGELVSEDAQYYPDRKKSVGVLKIAKLKRSHLLAVYSCEVSNSKVQPPLVVRVAVDMYLRPLEVSLVGENMDLSAGRKHNITCRSKGSRPPATITWWKVTNFQLLCHTFHFVNLLKL